MTEKLKQDILDFELQKITKEELYLYIYCLEQCNLQYNVRFIPDDLGLADIFSLFLS